MEEFHFIFDCSFRKFDAKWIEELHLKVNSILSNNSARSLAIEEVWTY